MYLTKATINGIEETCLRPVVISVTQDVIKFLNIPANTPLRIGDNPPLRLTKNIIGEVDHIPDIPDSELFVEYEDLLTEDYNVSLINAVPTTGAIYADRDIYSYVAPLRSRRTLTLSYTYLAKSKSAVTKMLNRLKMREVNDTRSYVHDIEYHYYIPDIIIELLADINKLKNSYTLPQLDFDTYVANTFDTRATVVNSEDGDPNKVRLAIRCVEESVIGTLDSDVHGLEKSLDSDTSRWSISFDYSIIYELPMQLLLSYPVLVYNQPIPAKYRLTNRVGSKSGSHSTDSYGIDKISGPKSRLLSIPDNCYYLRIPMEDNLTLPETNTGYVRLFSTIIVVDTLLPNDVFYLDELPGLAFAPEILALLKLEAPRIGNIYSSIYHIELFNHNRKDGSHKVIASVVTENIAGVPTERVKLSTDSPLDIKVCYRLSFNMLIDLTMLPTKFLDQLKNNVDIVDKTLPNNFTVIDTALSVLNLNTSMLNPDLTVNNTTTSWTIALNVKSDLWNRFYTKQITTVLTEVLQPK